MDALRKGECEQGATNPAILRLASQLIEILTEASSRLIVAPGTCAAGSMSDPARRSTTILTIALLAIGFLLPHVGAQNAPSPAATPGINNPETPVKDTLYFHVFDALQEIPINTQLPDDKFNRDQGVGLQTHSTTCLSQSDGDSFDRLYHQFFGYSSPGYVEYNVTGDTPRVHPERGLSFDVELDGDTIMLTWFISTTLFNTGQSAPDPYVIVPDVAIHAWMRSGEDISINNEAYKSGTVYAEGETVGNLGGSLATSHTDSGAGDVIYHPAKNGKGEDISVYEYRVPLQLNTKTIKKEAGFNIQIAVFLKTDTCPDPKDKILMPNLVHVHTSSSFRPHMDVMLRNPVRIEYMHPQFIGDDLVVHTSSNSPWGNYDVDETPTPGTKGVKGGIELSITGPSEARSTYRASIVQRTYEHFFHTQAVDVTFVWPFKSDGAMDGTYSVALTVWNDQRTAKATGVTEFTVGKDPTVIECGATKTTADAKTEQGCKTKTVETTGPGKQAPHLELAGVLGALGAVAAVLRRRDD